MGLHSVLIGIRSLILIPVSVLVLAVIATIMAFFSVDERTINGKMAKRWARLVLWLAAAEVTVRGLEKIPSLSSSYIVVMNHQSNMDIPVLQHSLPNQLRYIGKIELKKIPVFGSALIRAGHFLIDRKDHQKAIVGLKGVGEKLKERGVSVVFAPEGTRSRDGRLLPFKKGAFVMAIETGIPILPVTIDGTRNSLARGSLWAQKAEVKVTIHEPVPTASLTYEDRDELLEKVRGVMIGTLQHK
jgi:1-acyl-sn-glycerol-3-phosphate acyltransferase